MPAYVAIGIWFVFQFISSLGILGGEAQEGGVAYGAHIGGFLAGLALVKFFARGEHGAGRCRRTASSGAAPPRSPRVDDWR